MAVLFVLICDGAQGSPTTTKVWHSALATVQHMIYACMIELTQCAHFWHSKVKTVLVKIKVQSVSFVVDDVKSFVQV